MNGLRAVVFDTDGVLLATADRHAAAWKETFDGCLPEWQSSHAAARPRPFDAVREYRDLVDGRSRLDGVRAFLAARHVDLPPGTPEDPPGCATVHAVAARKEEVFAAMLRTGGVRTFEDVRPALQELRGKAVRCAAVSASRHARSFWSPRNSRTVSTPWWTAGTRPCSGFRANPNPHSSSRLPAVLACLPQTPPWWRTLSPASRPDTGAASGWWWGSTARTTHA